MTLLEVAHQIDTLAKGYLIWATRINGEWTRDSQAVLSPIPEDLNPRPDPPEPNMDCVLPVEIAQEAVDVWMTWSGEYEPSDEEKLRAIIHYAEHDAYLPIEEE